MQCLESFIKGIQQKVATQMSMCALNTNEPFLMMIPKFHHQK